MYEEKFFLLKRQLVSALTCTQITIITSVLTRRKCRKDTENRVWGVPRERALLTVPLTGIWKGTKLSIEETVHFI